VIVERTFWALYRVAEVSRMVQGFEIRKYFYSGRSDQGRAKKRDVTKSAERIEAEEESTTPFLSATNGNDMI
jgi:hypothetical protein